MEIYKQYITQAIVVAANSLKLTSEKIELVTLLKLFIEDSISLQEDILALKKNTDLSKIGIKIDHLYKFINQEKIDFNRISDKFKEHSSGLITELDHLLTNMSPLAFIAFSEKNKRDRDAEVNQILEQAEISSYSLGYENLDKDKHETDRLKEHIILAEVEKDNKFKFEDFERRVLQPVNELDSLLKRLSKQEFTDEELEYFAGIIDQNELLCNEGGFEMVAQMHKIFSLSLNLIKDKKMFPVAPVIEGMRACLIVIVAVVRNKDVDITDYLTRAESFGDKIFNLNGE